jgi:hypothetical protein
MRTQLQRCDVGFQAEQMQDFTGFISSILVVNWSSALVGTSRQERGLMDLHRRIETSQSCNPKGVTERQG